MTMPTPPADPAGTAGTPAGADATGMPAAAAAATALVPPPGCPAHAGGVGPTALYGPAAERDPAGIYARLRETHGPVAPVELEGGVHAWLVLGYRENMEAARNPSRFTRDARIWNDWKTGRVTADSPLAPIVAWRPDCASQDGEEHQRLRSAVNDCLARFDQHGVRRHIQRYANQLIDGFAPDGKADLVGQFATRLPMLVFTRLFGMTEEAGPRLIEASAGLVKGGEKAVAYNDYINETLLELTVERRAAPRHDFTSWLVQHPSGLTDDEVVGHLRMVMVAGNETTVSLISSTLRMVLTDPRFRASLAGGLMTLPDAVEQMLWDEPPLMVCPSRFATADMTFGGQQVREGDLLVLGLAAGNTDPDVRPDPQAPMHGNRSHLAFSRGPHECPGQEIARAITDTGVDVLLSRLPDLVLAVDEADLSWTATTWNRHLNALPVTYAPQRRPVPQSAETASQAPAVPSQRAAEPTQGTAEAPDSAALGSAYDGAPVNGARYDAAGSGGVRGKWRSLLGRLFGGGRS